MRVGVVRGRGEGWDSGQGGDRGKEEDGEAASGAASGRPL